MMPRCLSVSLVLSVCVRACVILLPTTLGNVSSVT